MSKVKEVKSMQVQNEEHSKIKNPSDKNEGNSFDLSKYLEFQEEQNSINLSNSKKNDIVCKNMIEAEIKMHERGINFPEKVTHVNIEYLFCAGSDLNPYPVLSGEEFDEMEVSLKEYGQIFPFLLVKQSETEYTLLDGNSRTAIMRYLNLNSKKEIFKTAKCFVIESNDIDILEMQDIILSCNISRKCNTQTMTKVYMMRIEIEKMRKVRKNDLDIHKKVASDMGVSVSTVYNYRALFNCSDTALFLLDCGHINSISAKKLAKFPIPLQDLIIHEFGIDNVRNEYLKYIKPDIEVKDIKETVNSIKNLKHPTNAVLKISGDRDDVLFLKSEIDKICDKKERFKKLKIKLFNADFNFKCENTIDGTFYKNEPKCYTSLLSAKSIPQNSITQNNEKRE